MRLGAGAHIAVAHVDLAHQIEPPHRRVPVRRLNLAIECLVMPCLVGRRVDLRERDVVPCRPAQRFLALCAGQERRVRSLHQRRRQGSVFSDGPVLALIDEVFVGTDPADDVEGFEEHLARLLLVDAECCEFGRP